MSCIIGSPRGGDSTPPKTNPREFDVTVSYDKTRGVSADPAITWKVICAAGVCTVSPQQQDITNAPNPGFCTFTFTAPADGDYTIVADLIQTTNGVDVNFGHDSQSPIHVSNLGPSGPSFPGGIHPFAKAPGAALAAVVGAAATTKPTPHCPPPIHARGKIGVSNFNDPIIGAVLEIYHTDFSQKPPQIVVDFVAVPTLVEDTFGAVFDPEARKHNPHVKLHILKLGGHKDSYSFLLPASW